MTPGAQRPTRTDIAQDLVGRVEAARRTWRAPGHERVTAPTAVTQAAQQAVVADVQALRRIVAQHGWPGRALVGDAGCQAALIIALQANHDLPFQATLLKMLADAVRRGDATTAQWAHLCDRFHVQSNQPQQYGTQYWLRDGRLELHPVADPEGLDTRRAGVGLPPHRDQVTLLERHHITAATPAVLAPATSSSPAPAANEWGHEKATSSPAVPMALGQRTAEPRPSQALFEGDSATHAPATAAAVLI
ncbi:DUF6624 domain-containing protein [Streptomyces sp. NPDC001165]|uniref:DUF6624 domain-containing protein n=1 Tax=Streptomyces sp. NPDC001165 TaxID=3364546 RepID=UPI0036C67E98